MSKLNEARPSHLIAYEALDDAIGTLTALRPIEPTGESSHYGQVIVDLRKVFAYFYTYIFIPAAQGDTKED